MPEAAAQMAKMILSSATATDPKQPLGESAFVITQKDSLGWGPFTMFYYSLVTFTTLGFGDITPRTPIAAAVVMLEVVVGYMMLGILISILATKVARRS